MRLGEFISANLEEILAAWEDYARRFWQGPLPDSQRLRNDAEAMIRALVRDMDTNQSLTEQKEKSEGSAVGDKSGMNSAAAGHALARVEDGFDIGRMVAEFRALRATISRIWWKSVPVPHIEQINDMERFNEALDQLVAASVKSFTERVDRNRRLFLGILGHDMRQPLHSIQMFAAVLAESEFPPETTASILGSIGNCCDSMSKMLGDLLDYASTQLGSELPINPAQANLGEISQEILNQVKAIAPDTVFTLETIGALDGEWDARRLGQLISNLLSNAVQHGEPVQPVSIRAVGSADEVTLQVGNKAEILSDKTINSLFDPLVRMAPEGRSRPQGSLGLGLYICKQIAIAHGGDITAEYSEEEGVVFTTRLPKRKAGCTGKAG